MNSLSIVKTPYTFCKKVPQELPLGLHRNMDEIALPDEAIYGFLQDGEKALTMEVSKKGTEVINSLKFYATTTAFETINRQMRTNENDPIIAQHIRNIFHSMDTSGFYYNVCLFRTESNNYTQNVGGKEITSRKLSIGDSWHFPSFISTAITNKPLKPKIQLGKLTVFVFEFDKFENIRGHYLGDSLGVNGEDEFLLSPGVAKVKEAYKLKIGLGFNIKKAKFVVVNLQFTAENSNIPSEVKD